MILLSLDSPGVVVTPPFCYQSYQLTASNSQTHAINLARHQAVCVGKAGRVLGETLEAGWCHQALQAVPWVEVPMGGDGR